MIFGIGLLVLGILGLLGILFGYLIPEIQSPQVTAAIGPKVAAGIGALVCVGCIVGAILKFAGAW